MENRRLDHLGDLAAVLGAARVDLPVCGEANLIVDDDVHRAAGFETAGLRHLKRFHHDALPRKRGIAVNQYRGD